MLGSNPGAIIRSHVADLFDRYAQGSIAKQKRPRG